MAVAGLVLRPHQLPLGVPALRRRPQQAPGRQSVSKPLPAEFRGRRSRSPTLRRGRLGLDQNRRRHLPVREAVHEVHFADGRSGDRGAFRQTGAAEEFGRVRRSSVTMSKRYEQFVSQAQHVEERESHKNRGERCRHGTQSYYQAGRGCWGGRCRLRGENVETNVEFVHDSYILFDVLVTCALINKINAWELQLFIIFQIYLRIESYPIRYHLLRR